MDAKPQRSSLFNRSRTWLSQVVPAPEARQRRGRLIATGAMIFLAAFGVRLIHWQDDRLTAGADQSSLVSRYQQQARRMLDGHGVLYPTGYQERASIQLLLHPPGYSIFIATVFGLFGNSDDNLVRAQIICDSFAAVLVFVIALQLLPFGASALAGLLVGFSPHLAHQSLILLPESLAVLPILVAVLLLIQAIKKPRLVEVIAAGAMIGVSCWLRSNPLLLAPFVAVAILPLFEPGRRLKYATALVFATIAVIAPITVRNWVVYGRFIPLSLGSGITMIEGIADYDNQNRFGMPATDDEAQRKDIEWHNRPDYALGLWRPDGIERDRYRFSRGLEVVRKNPVWFAGVMMRRAGSMLRYNDSLSQGWPADTSSAPIVSAEPSFGHQLLTPDEPLTSTSAAELLAKGRVLSPRTECAIADDQQTLTLSGNDSDFDDQFSSAPITVAKNSDYILRVAIKLIDGRAAVKVTSVDRRITLASRILTLPETEPAIRDNQAEQKDEDDNASKSAARPEPSQAIGENPAVVYLLPFATGNRGEVLLVVSNNGSSSARSKTEIGAVELFELGGTPHQWSRLVRPTVRGVEKNVYQTSRLLPLIGLGIILLTASRRWRALVLLLVVPAYYLSVQSALHTEYRYILAIHYFLLAIAAVTVYWTGVEIKRGFGVLFGWLRALVRKGEL